MLLRQASKPVRPPGLTAHTVTVRKVNGKYTNRQIYLALQFEDIHTNFMFHSVSPPTFSRVAS